MKSLIVRADDCGLSEAVTLGILSAFKRGVVTCTGLIVNLPFSREASDLLKAVPQLGVGLHVNLIVGEPCSEKGRVSGMVDPAGHFISSKIRRGEGKEGIDGFSGKEAEAEIEAQLKRFLDLNGKMPEYIDCHSVSTPTTDQAIRRMAKKYGISHVAIRSNQNTLWTRVETKASHYEFFREGKPLYQFFNKKYVDIKEGEIGLLVVHPGFLDQEVMERSSMTTDRIKDHAMLIDPRVRAWMKESQINLLSFRELH